MKTIKLFGKTVPIFLLIGILCAGGMGSAALLTYYGIMTTTVTVEQAITTNMPSTLTYTIIGGDTKTDGPYNLVNHANVPVTVKFATTYSPDGDGITTTYRGILDLTTKNVVFGTSPWTINEDKTATIWYTLTGNVFDWGYINYAGFVEDDYTLIYYKDNSDRFNDPAAAITDISNSLPYETDGNIDGYNYCGGTYSAGVSTGDNYVHCHGAKLWLVPIADINPTTKVLTWTDASNFLFETDLISYTQINNGNMILPSNGGGVNFETINAFDVALQKGTYTITTNVLPVA